MSIHTKSSLSLALSILIIVVVAFLLPDWVHDVIVGFAWGFVVARLSNQFINRVTREHPFNADMKGFDWALNTVLTFLFKYRDIVKEEDGKQTLYLRRFYLWSRGNKQDGYKGALFLHNIRRSDNDRHLHDHPWDFTTRILAGGYMEQLSSDMPKWYPSEAGQYVTQWRVLQRGDTASNPAEHSHKVHLFHDSDGKPISTWTLVKAGAARRIWGFITEDGWVDWRTYLNIPDETVEPIYGEDVIPKK